MEFDHHHNRDDYQVRDNKLERRNNINKASVDGENNNTDDIDSTADPHDSPIQYPFQVLVDDMGNHTMPVPVNDSTDNKLRWLRSQIIGAAATQVDTPFGTRRLTYADHTATGRSLLCIENYIAANLLPFYGNTHSFDSHVGHHTTKMAHEASQYIKNCLGGGENDVLIFCGSGSTAAIKRLQEVMGIAVPSILRDRILASGCLREEEKWVVFVGPYEHHSNILTWQQTLAAEVVEIGFDRCGHVDIAELEEKLELHKNRGPIIGSFSACSNVTGICTDTRAIARLLHQFGGFACFDFAASGPYAKIKMRSGEMDGYDAIFLSTHKFVGGPGSPGILLMSKALYRLGSSPPSTCGGGTVHFVNGKHKDTLYSGNIEEREDAGTPAIIQKVRGALAFWIKEYIGYKVIARLEKRNIERALERLVSNPRICVLGNTTAKRQAILSFLIYSTTNSSSLSSGSLDMWSETGNAIGKKPLHGSFVAKLLNDLFGIQARGGCACAGPYGHRLLQVDEQQSYAFRSIIKKGYGGIKPGWTRVSFPYYMAEEEVEFILAAIEFVAIYGQRFLVLYHFNWKTGAWIFNKNALKDNTNYSDSVINGASSLANIVKALNLEYCKERDDPATKKEDMLCKYTNYLEIAKRIARLLPKFPPHKRIPQQIDVDLLPFTT